MTDTNILREKADTIAAYYGEPHATIVRNAADELDTLRAENERLVIEVKHRTEDEFDCANLREQLRKSEEWGAEMKRLANEQADLANTWMQRANESQQQLAEAQVDCKFLLSFVPQWAKDVPDGLCPTMYGTLTADGDRKIKARVDSIRAAIEAASGKGVGNEA